jgi:hypothetical protein
MGIRNVAEACLRWVLPWALLKVSRRAGYEHFMAVPVHALSVGG